MENISRNRSIKFKNFNSLVEAIQTLSSKNSEWKVKHFFRRLSILVSEPSCDSSRFIRIYQAKIWKRLSLPMTTHCYFFFSMHVILWLLLSALRQEKERKKLSLFTNDNCVCMAKADKSLELIRDVSNLAGKKIDINNYIYKCQQQIKIR